MEGQELSQETAKEDMQSDRKESEDFGDEVICPS